MKESFSIESSVAAIVEQLGNSESCRECAELKKPVAFHIPESLHIDYLEIQKQTNQRFGKLLQEVIVQSIKKLKNK